MQARRAVPAAAFLAALVACNRPPAGPVMEPMTQVYSTQNGLITAHYPAAFAANAGSESRIQLNRTAPVDVSLSLSAHETPVSTDVNEYARVVLAAMIGTLDGYQELGRAATTCNGAPGIQARGTFRGGQGTPFYWSACAFVRNGHGYTFFYVVPQADVPAWAPMLQGILDATTFNR